MRNERRLWIQWRGNVLHLELIWGTPINSRSWGDISVLLVLRQCCWGRSRVQSSKSRLLMCFNWENTIALHAMQGNRASSHGEWEVSLFFFSCARKQGYILELGRGWSFKARVCSVMSRHLSSYERHLRNIYEAWQCNTHASWCDTGDPGSLSSCHSDIGIPINFQEESLIVTFWNIEFCVLLKVSNGYEASCPVEAGI